MRASDRAFAGVRASDLRRALLLLPAISFLAVASVPAGQGEGADRWKGSPQEAFYNSVIIDRYQCDTCHTIMERGGTVGPILNQVANRRTEDWIRHWLKDPNAIKPGTKMPTFNFTPEEYEQVVGYLSAMKRELDAEAILSGTGSSRQKGEALFEEYDCYACHRIGSQGRFIGPDLTWLGRRKTREWERVWLKAPEAWQPGTFMPNFHLSPGSIEELTAFLESLNGESNQESQEWEFNVNFFLNNRSDRRGELIFKRLACWSCHGEQGVGGTRNPNAAPSEEVPGLREAANDYDKEELKNFLSSRQDSERLDPGGQAPPFSCPDYTDALNEGELEDLYAYLVKLAPKKRVFRFK